MNNRLVAERKMCIKDDSRERPVLEWRSGGGVCTQETVPSWGGGVANLCDMRPTWKNSPVGHPVTSQDFPRGSSPDSVRNGLSLN